MPKLDRHSALLSLNCFVAAMLALWIAFALGLPRPYWAMMTVYITSNPLSGAVRSKAVYRLVGTLAGAVAALVLVPNLVDAPVLLSLALALWVAGCLVVSMLDRTPRSYMLMLAGYTAALIGFPAVDHPEAIFDLAVARVEEIGLGVICAAVVHSLVFPRPVGAVIEARLAGWLESADRWLMDVLAGESAAETVRDRRLLAAAASEVRVLATHLPFDTSRLRDTEAAVRAMHERMLLLVPLLSGLADRREALAQAGGEPAIVQARIEEAAAWLRAGARFEDAEALAVALRAGAAEVQGDWPGLLSESLLERLADAVVALGACHALLDHLQHPDAPAPAGVAAAMARAEARPLHSDLGLALRSGATCAIATLAACALWIATGWSDGAGAAAMAAVFCAMYAAFDDPAPGILAFGAASVATLVLGAAYNFAILPAIDGFPLLVVVLLPPYLVFGLYLGDQKTAALGVALAVTFGNAAPIQQGAAADFAGFLNGNLGTFVGLYIALFATRALRSISAEASVRRLLRRTWSAIARLAGHGAAIDPAAFAARLVDRLALLTPRLALHEAGGDAVAADALRDLRVAMNLASLKLALADLDGPGRAPIDGVLDGLKDHYAGKASAGAHSASPALLDRLDAALSSVAAAGMADRRAALGLVGLRRNLFPSAAAFVVQEPTP